MKKDDEDSSPHYVGKALTGREENAWNRFMVKLEVNDVHHLVTVVAWQTCHSSGCSERHPP